MLLLVHAAACSLAARLTLSRPEGALRLLVAAMFPGDYAARPVPDTALTVLGIESSCDETAAAVVQLEHDGSGRVLSDVVATQIAEHAPYGGVVPELASRAHLRAIEPVVRRALETSGGWNGITAVAVTAGPGLIGALLVGVQTAKAIAYARKLPIVAVNHLAGHLMAPFLDRPLAIGGRPEYPFVALLASGGHTALYRVEGSLAIRELGATRDDAAGEAFDKVAKLCGLGYPGGPMIDRLAASGNPNAVKLPRPMRQRASLEFSFSGLKTAVATHVARIGGPPREGAGLEDLAASVQAAIVDTLVRKLVAACEREGVRRAVISGGVAANRGLRAEAERVCTERGIVLHVPPAKSCTDNAAMIAYAGAMRLRAGHRDGLEFVARANWPVEEALGPA
jgi:N6-L-threonylcarbamoyladenine synthase